jgi:hypothetical protein
VPLGVQKFVKGVQKVPLGVQKVPLGVQRFFFINALCGLIPGYVTAMCWGAKLDI